MDPSIRSRYSALTTLLCRSDASGCVTMTRPGGVTPKQRSRSVVSTRDIDWRPPQESQDIFLAADHALKRFDQSRTPALDLLVPTAPKLLGHHLELVAQPVVCKEDIL